MADTTPLPPPQVSARERVIQESAPSMPAERDGSGAKVANGPVAVDAAARAPAARPVDDRFDEDLVHRVSPLFKLLRLYSRLEVEGIERIPDGGAVLAANHTGWIGLDYA